MEFKLVLSITSYLDEAARVNGYSQVDRARFVSASQYLKAFLKANAPPDLRIHKIESLSYVWKNREKPTPKSKRFL